MPACHAVSFVWLATEKGGTGWCRTFMKPSDGLLDISSLQPAKLSHVPRSKHVARHMFPLKHASMSCLAQRLLTRQECEPNPSSKAKEYSNKCQVFSGENTWIFRKDPSSKTQVSGWAVSITKRFPFCPAEFVKVEEGGFTRPCIAHGCHTASSTKLDQR